MKGNLWHILDSIDPDCWKTDMDQMLPKMLIGGFTSVAIVSIVLAGFFVKFP